MLNQSPMVLLVEDDQDAAFLYEVLLTTEGYKVEVCHDSWQALDWWESHGRNCDLVVLDMDLPGLDGFKLFERFKTGRKPCPPAMMLSAHGDPTLARKCKEVGVTIFLDKLKDMARFIPMARGLLV